MKWAHDIVDAFTYAISGSRSSHVFSPHSPYQSMSSNNEAALQAQRRTNLADAYGMNPAMYQNQLTGRQTRQSQEERENVIFSCSFPEASVEYNLSIEAVNNHEFLIRIGCLRGSQDWWRDKYFPDQRKAIRSMEDEEYRKEQMQMINTQETMFNRVIDCFHDLRNIREAKD